MVSAEITLADGRRGTLTGPTREAVEAKARWLADPEMGSIRQSIYFPRPSTPHRSTYSVTPPFLGGRSFDIGGPLADFANAAANVDDKTSTPILLGTMGALATGGTSLIPSVIGAGLGGAGGGALAESQDPNATRGQIAGAALRGGATMAASELAGFGLGAAANKLIAPNLGRYADPLRPTRERFAASGLRDQLRTGVSRVGAALPNTGRLGTAIRGAGRFARSPLGGEALEAVAVPAAGALFGPTVAIPLWLARAAFAPGVLQRYLANSRLPNAAVRTVGRRSVTTGIGAPILHDQAHANTR